MISYNIERDIERKAKLMVFMIQFSVEALMLAFANTGSDGSNQTVWGHPKTL